MAEPTNTPVPASTPRSASPALPSSGPNAPIVPHHTSNPSISSPLSPNKPTFASKPRILHIGDPIRYNPQTYLELCTHYELVRPSGEERQRPAFIQALKEGRWGDFHAIFRPFWGTGGEMGNWDAELIGLLPKTVKVFASAGAGFDWADTKLLGERGVIYCNAGLAAAEAVADFAVAMLISTFRMLPWCTSAALSSDPQDFQDCHKNATTQSHNLKGHVLGLIGLGNIGQQIATRCRYGFGMEIHYYDIAPISENLTEALGATRHGSLESLLRTSDCVILCTPAVPPSSSGKTELITEKELGYFRPGGRFINVARGSLVSSSAVADALDNGQLSSAALDVHPNEPNIDERLKAHARQGRCMLTCHNAGGTVETHKGFEELSMRNIMKVLQGQDAITPVNLQHLR